MRGRGAAIQAPALVLLLSACSLLGGPGPTPVPGLAGTRSDGEPFHVLITDETGWMVAATATWPEDPPAVLGGGGDVLENDPANARVIVLGWLGGACDQGQRVTLSSQRGLLQIALDVGSVAPRASGDGCVLVGRGYAIRLEFDRDVPAHTVGLHRVGSHEGEAAASSSPRDWRQPASGA
jgi:hypothetical protein